MRSALPPLPRYSRAEEWTSTAIHAVGAALGVAGLVLLMILTTGHRGTLHAASCLVYGASLILLYAASTFYHALTAPRAKQVMRVLDHCAIYLLIAGTYTPLSLIVLGGRRGTLLCVAVWLLALLGIVLQAVDMTRFKLAGGVLYLAMGWLAVVAARPLVAALATPALVLIVLGGILYTAGFGLYALRRLPFNHALWHAVVLAASALHFFAVLGSVAS